MYFLIGSEDEFENFLKSISQQDKVGIVVHGGDLDGLVSGIMLEDILKKLNLSNYNVFFAHYGTKDDFLKLIPELRKVHISKTICADMCLEGFDNFEDFKKEFNVFVIDHHPLQGKLRDTKNIIKSQSSECAAWDIYNLGLNLGLISDKKFKKLLNATLFSEFSYKNKNVFEFLKQDFKDLSEENIFSSKLAKFSNILSNTIIYFEEDKQKVYDLLKNKNFRELKQVSKEVEKEVQRVKKEFSKNAEFYPNERVYFFEVISKFKIASIISTAVSVKEPDNLYILYYYKGDSCRITTRCQSKRVDMNMLMKKGIQGCENALGGGHAAASGATISKKDFPLFKENILKSLRK